MSEAANFIKQITLHATTYEQAVPKIGNSKTNKATEILSRLNQI